jgi:hypothetical protein
MKRLAVIVAFGVAMLGNAASSAGRISGAKADSASDEWQLIGTWTGESICQVKNSPCHDEKAIYLVSKSLEGTLTTPDKIVYRRVSLRKVNASGK